jgi:hypothetical protein
LLEAAYCESDSPCALFSSCIKEAQALTNCASNYSEGVVKFDHMIQSICEPAKKAFTGYMPVCQQQCYENYLETASAAEGRDAVTVDAGNFDQIYPWYDGHVGFQANTTCSLYSGFVFGDGCTEVEEQHYGTKVLGQRRHR